MIKPRTPAGTLELLPGEPLMSRDNVLSMRVPNVASGTLPGLANLGITPDALRTLAAGKHVFVEKPLALKLDDLARIDQPDRQRAEP